MTRKRFKLGLAALCLLAAFVMAVIGLLLAPTLASAGKNNETGHQHADESDGHGASNPIYSEHLPETEKATWNAPPAGPCVAQSCSHQDDALSYEDGPAADQGHSSSGEGGQGENTASDAGHGQAGGGFAGGYGGGSSGGFSGGPSQGSPVHVGSDDQDDSKDKSKGKSKSGDSGSHDGEPEIHVSSSNDPYHDPSHDPDAPPFDPPKGPPGEQQLVPNSPNQVPEPLPLSLFAFGLAGLAVARRGSNA